MATIEEKAAAFDALIKMLKGREEFVCVREYAIPNAPAVTPPRGGPDYVDAGHRTVFGYEYEWRIRGRGHDIEALLLEGHVKGK